ncbi:MAG: hypothetical protein U0931_11930 [Vulcanimicrobiota bacterium]
MSSCAQAPLYRQREFHQSPLWRLLVDHGEDMSLATTESGYVSPPTSQEMYQVAHGLMGKLQAYLPTT